MSGLLHRLRLSHKFLILGLLALCMVALPTLLFLGESLRAMRGAGLAAAGMPPLAAVQQAITRLQVHRGLSSGMLNGDTALAERRPAVRDALHQALDTARERLVAADAPAASRAQLEQARQTWQALEQAVAARSIAAPDSLARHTALVEALMRLNETLLHDYGLQLSPRADQQALAAAGLVQAPLLAEHLGRLRAQGSGALAQQQLAPEARGSLRALLRRVDELSAATARASERALAADPGLQARLAPALQQARERVQAATQLAASEVTDKDSLSLAPARYFDVLTQAIEAVNQFADTGIAALADSLQAGVQHQQQRLAWLAALQLALLAGAVALARVFVRSITQPLDQAVTLARAVAAGELDGAPIAHGRNEMGQLLAAQLQMRTQLRTVVAQVREGSDSVATASAQIAQGNHDLSARTENQAAALEETAASMEQLSATVRHNADSAREASQLAAGARDVAQRGGAAVQRVVQTMHGIDQASRQIADITGVIDGIAFQTNILALNAAVEAARAGEQGRGFAVVAGEVRTLAQRSAAAAKEIKGLIATSAGRVQEGNHLASEAGQTMDGVVQAIAQLHGLVSSISSASQEQASGVAQVGEAVTQMDQATQQNAALVEEMAAAATHLRGQAQELVAAVAVFRGAATGPAHAPAALALA